MTACACALRIMDCAASSSTARPAPFLTVSAAIEPFSRSEPAPLLAWMERLGGLLDWSGISARVAAVTGLFNINLQAYRKLEETLASLRQAGRLFPEYRYTFSEWLFLLKKTFMRTRYQVPPDDEGGVQVLGLEESMGRPWEEAFRDHLRRRAAAGDLGPDIVAIGPFWTAAADPGEIDAVALAGRGREAVLLGEAKWAKRVDAAPLRAELERFAAEVRGFTDVGAITSGLTRAVAGALQPVGVTVWWRNP